MTDPEARAAAADAGAPHDAEPPEGAPQSEAPVERRRLPPAAPALPAPDEESVVVAGPLPALPAAAPLTAPPEPLVPAHDPSRPPPIADEEDKRRQLARMKRRASLLLAGAAVLFVVARSLEGRYPWLGYVRAFAEAAMVGGVADWFAVTALFRHPLGIPIPHTAIVPARKDRIGRSLGTFVQRNFLSREVVGEKLRAARVGERLARWIADPGHARSVARQVASALHGGASVLRDEDVESMIERGIVSRARRTQVAPLLGKLVTLMTADGRHQELLDEALKLAARFVGENEELIRDRIAAEAPWWVPELVEDRIHEKVVSALERTLQEVSADPMHPLRQRFDEAVETFAERLRTSPEVIARAESMKGDLLTHPAVREYVDSLWTDFKAALARYAEGADGGGAPRAVERGLVSFGEAMLADPALVAKVDGWITDAVLFAVEQYREEVSQLIESTVAGWDPAATSQRIELQIGKDLQFIRINGTLVGGLVGLGLYVIGKMF